MAERNVLICNVHHPFLIGLHYSFQTADKLYFVVDYVNGGEVSSFKILEICTCIRGHLCSWRGLLLWRAGWLFDVKKLSGRIASFRWGISFRRDTWLPIRSDPLAIASDRISRCMIKKVSRARSGTIAASLNIFRMFYGLPNKIVSVMVASFGWFGCAPVFLSILFSVVGTGRPRSLLNLGV